MLGPREALGRTFQRVRKGVRMEDPHELGKYLGCYHRIAENVCTRTGHTETSVEWGRSAYNRDAVTRYEKEDFRDKAFLQGGDALCSKAGRRNL